MHARIVPRVRGARLMHAWPSSVGSGAPPDTLPAPPRPSAPAPGLVIIPASSRHPAPPPPSRLWPTCVAATTTWTAGAAWEWLGRWTWSKSSRRAARWVPCRAG